MDQPAFNVTTTFRELAVHETLHLNPACMLRLCCGMPHARHDSVDKYNRFMPESIGLNLCSIKGGMATLNQAQFQARSENLQIRPARTFWNACLPHTQGGIFINSFSDLAGTGNAGAKSAEKKSCHHTGIIARLPLSCFSEGNRRSLTARSLLSHQI